MNPLRVLFHFDATPDLQRFVTAQASGLDIVFCPESDEHRLSDLLPTIDVWWHVLRPISGFDIDQAARLRLIQKFGTGVNTIDLNAAERREVVVCNLPGMNAQSVAEATLALMLMVSRRSVLLDRRTRAGNGWPIDTTLARDARDLSGMTIGLVGNGSIAQRVGHMLRAIGAKVVYTSTTEVPNDPDWRPLEALVTECDIVSLHVPLTTSTNRLFDSSMLARMRPGAILINTSRGEVVDETALFDLLASGHLGGAGLDVFVSEPRESSPLFLLDSVVVTPHVAWLTVDTMHRCVSAAIDNCRRLADGQTLKFVVAG